MPHPESEHGLRVQLATALRERDEAVAEADRQRARRNLCQTDRNAYELQNEELRKALAAANARADAAEALLAEANATLSYAVKRRTEESEALAAARRALTDQRRSDIAVLRSFGESAAADHLQFLAYEEGHPAPISEEDYCGDPNCAQCKAAEERSKVHLTLLERTHLICGVCETDLYGEDGILVGAAVADCSECAPIRKALGAPAAAPEPAHGPGTAPSSTLRYGTATWLCKCGEQFPEYVEYLRHLNGLVAPGAAAGEEGT